MRVALFLFVTILLSQATCRQPIWQGTAVEKIAGVTVVAPPRPIDAAPLLALKQLNAAWVAVIPYAFTRPTEPKVHYNVEGHQWWGERPEGVATTIRLAHESGLQVMLKPQVWIMGRYTGDLSWSSATDWAAWEADYLRYLLPMAKLADSLGVEMLCIGTEWKTAVSERPQFWSNLIDSVRKTYRGDLTYAANWDDYDDVPFWEKLDYVGVNAYWPLTKTKTPTINELTKAWQPFVRELGNFAAKQQKPVLFTEYGYLSVDSCAWKTWEREGQLAHIARNNTAQSNAIQAIWQSFSGCPWWAGGFLWKWFPNGMGHEGYPEKDYSPQGKDGEDVLKHWFGRLKAN